MANEKQVKVTLVKSTSGRIKVQQDTVAALGLHKIGQSAIFQDSASFRGMITKVNHLVKVEEL